MDISWQHDYKINYKKQCKRIKLQRELDELLVAQILRVFPEFPFKYLYSLQLLIDYYFVEVIIF